jgi:hypothetical protein
MLASIVEDFNNADITDKCATVKDAAESALEGQIRKWMIILMLTRPVARLRL